LLKERIFNYKLI